MTRFSSAALFQKLEPLSQEFFQLSDQLVQTSADLKEPGHQPSEIFGFHCAVLVKLVFKMLFKALFRLLSIIVSITVVPSVHAARVQPQSDQSDYADYGGYGDRGYRPLGSVTAR